MEVKTSPGIATLNTATKVIMVTVISTTGTTDITLPVRDILEADTSHTTGTVASMVFLMGAVSTTITVTVTTGTTVIHMVAANIMSLTKTPRTPQSVERISTG